MKKFNIKKLDFKGEDCFCADTPFGSYEARPAYSFELEEHGKPYVWEVCFAEYYDEHSGTADSLDEAMRACQKHWEDRILTALIEVE